MEENLNAPIVTTIRHDAITPQQLVTTPMTIFGVGGVGSSVVSLFANMQLAKPGVTMYDHDVVEAHNPPNQCYTRDDIGKPKVTALAKHAALWSDDQVPFYPKQEEVMGRVEVAGIAFLCLDKMKARKQIMHESIFNNPKIPVVVETRMDARSMVMYTIDPNCKKHQKLWNDYWFPDIEAENEAGCGGHYAVRTTVTMTAALAVQQVMYWFEADEPGIGVPNQTIFNLRNMTFEQRVWSRD